MHIGIIGCGQLARMLAIAGIPLGLRFSFLAEPEEDTRCVDGLGLIVRRIKGEDFSTLHSQLGHPAVITTEREQIDLELLQSFVGQCEVRPNASAFAACQHRYREKQLLDSLDIPNAPYTFSELAKTTASELGLPLIVKSCSDGYDGKNQRVLRSADDVNAFDAVREHDEVYTKDYITEKMIPFEREVSQVSVRGVGGQIQHYPLAENRHVNGILSESLVPAAGSATVVKLAQAYISKIMSSLDYIGVMAVECFVVGDELLVNELAPRVHNSGHWTQVGGIACQFENHVRAIAGLPLGSTDFSGFAGMFNLIGTASPPQQLISTDVSLNWYNKTPRQGRKVGHMNVLGDSREGVERALQRLREAEVRNL